MFEFSNPVPDSAKLQIGLYAGAHVNSTAITTRFTSRLLRGGYISQGEKDEVRDRLQDVNYMGGNAGFALSVGAKVDSVVGKPTAGLGWYTRLADMQHLNGRFSDKLFELTFYGNRAVPGNAGFDTTNINLLRYQQLTLGFVKTNKKQHRYGAGISLINGEQLLSVDVKRGNLYTALDGTNLTAELDAMVLQSDTAQSGFATSNGLGLAAEGFYEMNLSSDSANHTTKLRFEVRDLGMVQWSANTLRYTIDSVYSFNGLVINSLRDVEDSVLNARIDSISDGLRWKTRSGARTTKLPARFRIVGLHTVGQHTVEGGFEFWAWANHRGYAWISETWKPSKTWAVGGTLAYGGYGTVAVGVHAALHLNNFSILAGTRNLEGQVLPGQIGGMSAYTHLRFNF